jgi:hypothetical protein
MPDTPLTVYINEYEPWYGVLVADATSVEQAERAAVAETGHGLPMRYLGIRTEPIINENGSPGRRRRFHVFTDEPE